MSEQTYDLAILGAGPAGLAAFLAAAAHHAAVALIDDAGGPGGHYYKELPPAATYRQTKRKTYKERRFRQVKEAIARAAAQPGTRLLHGARVWGIFDESGSPPAADSDSTGSEFSLYYECPPDGHGSLRARSLVLAPGVYDRPLPFPGWDLPGVLTPGAVQMLLEKQGLLPGQRVLVAGSGPLQMVVAAALLHHGAQVVALLDTSGPFDGMAGLPAALGGLWSRAGEGASSMSTLLRGHVPVLFRHAVFQVLGTPGEGVRAAVFGKIDGQGHPVPGTQREVQVDTVCIAYGFLPSIAMTLHLGCAHHYDRSLSAFVPTSDARLSTSVPGVYVAGDVTGVGGKVLAELQGEAAAYAALEQVGQLTAEQARQEIARLTPAMRREERFARFLWNRYRLLPGLLDLADDETLLCHCEGVRLGALRQCLQEGGENLFAAKLRTRIGMGNCQGRYCLPTAALYIAAEGHKPAVQLDLPSIRPPVFPVRLEDIAAIQPAEPVDP